MTMPGFTAEESIRSQRSSYRRGVQMMEENVVVPSLLSATQCQWANDNCGDDPEEFGLQNAERLCRRDRAAHHPSSSVCRREGLQ